MGVDNEPKRSEKNKKQKKDPLSLRKFPVKNENHPPEDDLDFSTFARIRQTFEWAVGLL
jgi:hypothetical protein